MTRNSFAGRFLWTMVCVLVSLSIYSCGDDDGVGPPDGTPQTGWVSLGPPAHGPLGAIFGLSAIDAQTAIGVGSLGTIVKTTDGGTMWTTRDGGTSEWLEDVFFVDPDRGSAVGCDPGDGRRGRDVALADERNRRRSRGGLVRRRDERMGRRSRGRDTRYDGRRGHVDAPDQWNERLAFGCLFRRCECRMGGRIPRDHSRDDQRRTGVGTSDERHRRGGYRFLRGILPRCRYGMGGRCSVF